MNLPPQLSYRSGRLFFEDVPLARIADDFDTPTYVYSRAALEAAYARYAAPLAERLADGRALICYAVKANSNLAVLQCFARAGAGFDIVSGGELARVIAAGGDPRRIVFSGVGKRPDEMRDALAAGIRCFNVESRSEARQLATVATALGKRAPVSLRINPDVDAKTHPYIATGLKESKFGIAYADALDAYREVAALPALDVVGVDCHIGSQLLDEAPLLEALDKLLDLVDRLAADGIAIRHIDIGGGVGILYGDESTPGIDVEAYLALVIERLERWQSGRDAAPVELLVEPGRSLVGNAGVLLTRTLVLKKGETKNFAIVDAAMNDLMRPALYDAYHAFVPIDTTGARETVTWDIVGPVCESGDWLAHARELALAEGDTIAALSAGAYGMAMASNYNTRPRAAEVMIDGADVHLIREREAVASLFSNERLID
jgi:diaminopimelate decarboxylase